MLKNLSVISFFVLFLQFCTTNSSEPEVQHLKINDISIANDDSLSHGAGIIIQFSNAINLNSFNADSIYQQFDLYFNGPQGIETSTLDLDVYKIESAQAIQLNNSPLTFYYDPTTWTIALIEETTIQMPEGTGEGFYLNFDENRLNISKNLKDINGNTLENDEQITLYKSISNNRFKSVPNPMYYSTSDMSGKIMFTNLPAECEISILDINDATLKTVFHSGGATELWDLKDRNNDAVGSGIYRFKILNSDLEYYNGVFVLNKYSD
jgi:hypothetical protein